MTIFAMEDKIHQRGKLVDQQNQNKVPQSNRADRGKNAHVRWENFLLESHVIMVPEKRGLGINI